jgi:hypothetical protein
VDHVRVASNRDVLIRLVCSNQIEI